MLAAQEETRQRTELGGCQAILGTKVQRGATRVGGVDRAASGTMATSTRLWIARGGSLATLGTKGLLEAQGAVADLRACLATRLLIVLGGCLAILGTRARHLALAV